MPLPELAIAGLAAGGTALFNGVSSLLSNRSAYNAQREANETNIALAREQMRYQTSEREAMQRYNTPLAQRQRYEEAGINPYLAMNQMNNGNTQMQIGVTPAHVEPAVNDPYSGFVRSAGSAASTGLQMYQMYQNSLTQEEVNKGLATDNYYKAANYVMGLAKSKAEIGQILSKTKETDANYSNLKQQYKILENEFNEGVIRLKYADELASATTKKQREEAALAHEQRMLVHYQSEYQSIYNDLFPQLTEAQMAKLAAETTAAYSSANLSQKMAEHEIEKKANTITDGQIKQLEKDGVKIDNQYKASMYRANKNYIHVLTHKVRNTDNFVQNYVPLTGIVSAAVKKGR